MNKELNVYPKDCFFVTNMPFHYKWTSSYDDERDTSCPSTGLMTPQ